MAYVPVSALPAPVAALLHQLGYHRADIQLHAATTVDPSTSADAGNRAAFAAINLNTGERETHYGSWGGYQPYAPTMLDKASMTDNRVRLPVGVVAVRGEVGHRVYLQLYAHPDTLTGLLPASVDLTPEERKVLAAFRGIKSSYRGPYLQGKEHLISSLVARGFLKRNKAGATQITTAGKNACEGVNVY